MKKHSSKKMTLTKFTISRVTLDALKKVRGGDCRPTEAPHCESDVRCADSFVP